MNRGSLRIATLVFTVFAGLIVMGPPTVTSQGRNNKTEGPRSFGGRAMERRTQTPNVPQRAPAPLSAPELTNALKLLGKTEPGSVYVTLTPSQPDVANRGALVFLNPDVVEAGEGYASWTVSGSDSDPQMKYMMIWLKSAANRSYLIDCAVSGEYKPNSTEAAEFRVVGPDGNTTWFKAVNGISDRHLVFSLNATNAGWYGFQLRSPRQTPQTLYWRFYSCEVKNF